MSEIFFNPAVSLFGAFKEPSRTTFSYHQQLPAYQPTPLRNLAQLAERFGLQKLWIKDESNRLGLPAFKILGASWAIDRALQGRSNVSRLVCATDGNHGRAVAHVGKLLNIPVRVFVPQGTVHARIDGIRSEGAEVIVSDSYDDAVARASADADNDGMLVQDMGLPGYREIPEWIVQGYSTLLWEIEDELQALHEEPPTHVIIQMGVGSLADAVVRQYRRKSLSMRPSVIGIEPVGAACVLASIKAGRMVQLHGHQDSIMAGLNCGTPSELSFPALQQGVDCFVAIEDTRACEAMRLLADEEIVAGETGAAGLGGLLELVSGENAAVRSRLRMDQSARVLLVNTEGATDPESYRRIVRTKTLRRS